MSDCFACSSLRLYNVQQKFEFQFSNCKNRNTHDMNNKEAMEEDEIALYLFHLKPLHI